MTESKKVELIEDSNGNQFSQALSKIANYFGNQRHFSAIRDAFATFMPLIIVGSFGVLINSVFIDSGSLLATLCNVEDNPELMENWSNFAFFVSPIFTGLGESTLNLFSVYMSFLFGYFLSGSYGDNKVFGGLVSLACFMTFNPVGAALAPGSDGWAMAKMGTGGLFVAMFTGLTVPTFLNFLNKKSALMIRMPDGVPPTVSKSFSSLIPITIVVICYAMIQPIYGALSIATGFGGAIGDVNKNYYIMNAIYTFLFLPLNNMANKWYALIIVYTLMAVFWFFGIHGTNVMAPFISTFWTAAALSNAQVLADYGNIHDAVASGQLQTWTDITGTAFVGIGGTGATLSLLIALRISSKLPLHNKVSAIAMPPGVFNINEPVMFGIPVILNTKYFIPFVLSGPIMGIVAYVFIVLGWVYPATVVLPWTTPVYISGLLSTQDWRSIILTTIELVISIGLYLPFILLDVRDQVKQNPEILEQVDYEINEGKANKPVRKLEIKIDEIESAKKELNEKENVQNMKQSEFLFINEDRVRVLENNIEYYKQNTDIENSQEMISKLGSKLDKVKNKIESNKSKHTSKVSKINNKISLLDSKIDNINKTKMPIAIEKKENTQKSLDAKAERKANKKALKNK